MDKEKIMHGRKQKTTAIIFSTILSIFYSLFFIHPSSANALTMSNNNYILHTSLEEAGGKSASPNYRLGQCLGQTAPGRETEPNYTVRAGFEYTNTSSAAASSIFSFSVSQPLIDFGPLSATNPVTRTTILTVSTGTPHGYSVLASEDHALSTNTLALAVPDTTCDSGTCSEALANPWTNTLTYGLGYRCDNIAGTDCSLSFSDTSAFKQFANSSSGKKPQVLMSNNAFVANTKAQITYKVNISGTQAAGIYSNTITYIATPNF